MKKDVQFKSHNEFKIFDINSVPSTVGVHFLTAASTYGLIFAGNPYAARLNVFKHNDLVDAKYDNSALKTRVLDLSSPITALSCNADGNFLAIAYNLNGSPFLQIYSSQSFFTPNVTSICTIRLSADENTEVTELLWNPVISHCLAVILNNGAVGMYTLKDDGQFDIKTLDKALGTQCGSWSPKGKQIVLAFANGKLQQYKPDLTASRTIVLPPKVLESPFDTLSVCWLSTYQFAVVLLAKSENAFPHVVIVNAPKGAEINYKDFYDVCYSSDGPRKHRFMLTHISYWNLLLILSANGVELGVLGTVEKNDTPNWIAYSCADEARISLPLTEDHSDQYAIGFSVDTASKHRLTIKETEITPMPMIHILTTHGVLQTYNFINLLPEAASLCSPPPPKSDSSAKFSLLKVEDYRKKSVKEEITATQPLVHQPQMSTITPQIGGFAPQKTPVIPQTAALPQTMATTPHVSSYETFSFNKIESTSTPSPKPKPVPTFTNVTNQPFSNIPSFGVPNPMAQTIQNKTDGLSKFKQSNLMAVKPNIPLGTVINKASTEPPKALYTVSSDFTPTGNNDGSRRKSSYDNGKNFPDFEEMRKHVVYLDIMDFDREIQRALVKPINVAEELGDPKEFRNDTLTLLDLEKSIKEADTKDFQQEIRHLRHGIIDMYAILEEINANVLLSKHSDIKSMRPLLGFDKYNLRLVNKADEQIKSNKILMRKAELELDKQWILYQDLLRSDMPKEITAPRLNPIFQRLSKLVNISNRNMKKIDYLKTVLQSLGIRQKSTRPRKRIDLNKTEDASTLDILAKSILGKNAKAPPPKYSLHISPKNRRVALNTSLKNKVQVTKQIKSKRIKRSDINSHAILEARIRNLPPIRDGASTNIEKMQQQMLPQKNIEPSHTHLAKPTATKPVMIPTQTVFAPVGQTSTSGFNFGGTSPFVKTAAAVKSDEPARPIAVFPSNAGMMNFSGFHVPPTSSGGISATTNPLLVQPKATPNKVEPRKDLQSLSFVAKVVGGEASEAHMGQPLVAPTATQPTVVPVANKTEIKNADTATSANFSFLGDKTKPASTFGLSSVTPVMTTSTTTPSGGFSFVLPQNSSNNTIIKPTTTASGGFSFAPAPNASNNMPIKPTTTVASGFSFAPSPNASNNMPIKPTATTTTVAGGFSFAPAPNASNNMPIKPTTTVTAGFSFAPPPNASNNTLIKPTITTTVASGFSFAPAPNAPSNTILKSSNPILVTVAAEISPTTKSLIFTGSGTTITADPKGGFISFGSVKTPPEISTTQSPTPVSDPSDALLSNLNICKPTTKETGTTVAATTAGLTGNLFAGLGSNTGSSLFFNSLNPPTSTFSFDAAGSSFSKPQAVTGQTQVSTATTTITTTAPIATLVTTTITATKTTPTVKAAPIAKTAATAGMTPTIPPAGVIPSTIPATIPIISPTPKPAPTQKLSTMQKPVTTLTTIPPAIAPALATSAASPQPANLFSATVTSSNVIKSTANTTTTSPNVTAAISSGTPIPAFSSLSGLGDASTPETKTVQTNIPATSFNAPLFTVAGANTTATTTAATAVSKSNLSTATTATTTGSLFGGSGTAFGGTGSLFSTPIPMPVTSLFGNVPKTESSLFGSSALSTVPSGLFSPPAATLPTSNTSTGGIFSPPKKDSSPFGVSTGGNLFGNTQQPVNVFGNQETSSNTGSVFAAAANKPAEGGNIFSGGTQSSDNHGTGPLFGQFGQSNKPMTGNIFASSGAISQSPPTGFSTGGSLFGNAPANNMSTLFANSSSGGTASTFGSPNTGMGFGSFSSQNTGASAFGSTNTGSSFAQGGASVSQTGFGSPQQSSAFAKPVFGNTTAFGSPPAFGTQPSFGGAATFGSPKPFSSFGSPPATSPTANAFGGPQKNNLFETLGASDSGLSFGNLAQATQNNPPKPAFGGSSFMNYRA
ncbi:nuclear pore complex protein Nup214 isoform X2 [Teleopsis dalmanni]|uniref:nuclear pore complex protein Nup214 isoform X2 n=1 Tax=Teleopsis dalmanni TaxID=139649 RepID=UPI0018CD575B|nr:nuclear pore complex protein Nup214 isoform X2 [Teleopsis dalmanni]XP_037959774.1 nuclear pore complex protein Nup214 isoform X2 [Teleopsis dalmanni]